MLDFDFLTSEEVVGKNKLDIFKNSIHSLGAFMTDFSRLLGNGDSTDDYVNDNGKFYYFGHWYTKKIEQHGINWGDVNAIYKYGNMYNFKPIARSVSARPVIKYSKIKDLVKYKSTNRDGVLEIEFGEYPQFVVDDIDLKIDLQSQYDRGMLKVTGKFYTTDSVDYDDSNIEFKPYSHIEYEFNGEKYIRFVVGRNGYDIPLSDDNSYDLGETCWIKVEPIKWLVDEKSDKAICENAIFSGVQYCNSNVSDITDFKNTDIKRFMDEYFSKEILTKEEYEKLYRVAKEESVHNPYNFDFTEVTEEEIIKGAVESNVAVFLHGRSSEGKSARVKQIDPDCEIIYLRNATPDSLNGKSVFNSETNEMIDIPPTWYKKVVEKCEREPDKIHIIFFDEITNALPSIQGMAFNIVLNKEVNGKWKLPENARIVAAGNDLEESKAANEMAEPLFNRFAHVYINTTVDSWLKWASTPDEEYERLDYKVEEKHPKIHPAIYAYIAYKSYSKQDVLRTPYNGKTPNADPRKWEMSSKVLYKTKRPEMLRSLIGEDLTRDFAMFCSRQVLSVEDVINGNYTESDLDMDVSEKFNTAVGLSSVTEEHIEVVRDFVMKLGPEICATFDTLWTHGDENRLEKIVEIKLSERTK